VPLALWDLLNLEPCQGITRLYTCIYIQNHIILLYQRIHFFIAIKLMMALGKLCICIDASA
jgi:hypothetical protein